MKQCQYTTFSDIITALSFALDLDENRKLYHAWRVAIISHEIAARLPWRISQEQLFYGALLHDIGAIGYSDYLIHSSNLVPHFAKPFLSAHSKRGASILASIPYLKEAAEMVLDHHEHWDGSGYPQGKQGTEITDGGAIIRIADSMEVLIEAYPTITQTQLSTMLKARAGSEYPYILFEIVEDVFNTDSFLSNLQDSEWLKLRIKEITNQLIENLKEHPALYTQELQTMIRTFARVIDAKHEYTWGHSERVALYAQMLGEEAGLEPIKLEKLILASLLHDAGKLAVPRKILDKPGRLNQEEQRIIRRHPIYSEKIISLIPGFEEVAIIAGRHHECYDGTGYPNATRGEEIPFFSRIITVADSFDAMISNRAYQKARPIKTALRELERNAGIHFDPEIVALAPKVFNQDLPRVEGFALHLNSES